MLIIKDHKDKYKIDKSTFNFLYDYEEHQKHLESKRVRHGDDRTYTPVDFFTDEQIEEYNEKGIHNLEPYMPISDEIRDITKFNLDAFNKLCDEFPEDKFLKELDKEENLPVLMATDWYRKFGIEYDEDKDMNYNHFCCIKCRSEIHALKTSLMATSCPTCYLDLDRLNYHFGHKVK